MPRRFWYFTVPLIAWLAIIFATSSTWIDRDRFVAAVVPWVPGSWMKSAFVQFWDSAGGLAVVKGYHMGEFALLFVVCNKSLSKVTKIPATRAAVYSGAFCLFYAASDEWHQTFVPGRGGTWTDVVIDSVGIGIALFMAIRRAQRAQFGRDISAESISDPVKVIT